MFLKPGDKSGSSRSRSKSPGGQSRDRSRSRSNARADNQTVSPPRSARNHRGMQSSPYDIRAPSSPGTERSQTSPLASGSSTDHGASLLPYPSEDNFASPAHGVFPQDPRVDHMAPRSATFPSMPTFPEDDDGLIYGDNNLTRGEGRAATSPGPYPLETSMPAVPDSYDYGSLFRPYGENPASTTSGTSRSLSYTYKYADPPDKISYTATPVANSHKAYYTATPREQGPPQLSRHYDHRTQEPVDIIDMTPGSEKRNRAGSKSKHHRSSSSVNDASLTAPRSVELGARMNRLSVSGDRPHLTGLGAESAPPSPLLEAYQGTYQQMSPMPFAMRSPDEGDPSDLELDSAGPPGPKNINDKQAQDAQQKRKKKRVQIYDAEADARSLSKALSSRRGPDEAAVAGILPQLSHDNIMDLKKEYKKQMKIQGKGIVLSKHIKAKMPGNLLGKAVYVTALGRWESEGYWANFWYQSHSSRRELLIESLMGRPNADIWNIKDEFKDKRYRDSLVNCMESELKMDKFRTAVLLALDERRQEEQDVYPLECRLKDVNLLHSSITASKGGESKMLKIILRSSDAHLREVLKLYQAEHGENLAQAALKKSSNLVGEVIAHVLNGVINRPARDAILIRHAIKDIAQKNTKDDLRYDLLISRLVRLHWDKVHLRNVKQEYCKKYGEDVTHDIDRATNDRTFADFMYGLCNADASKA